MPAKPICVTNALSLAFLLEETKNQLTKQVFCEFFSFDLNSTIIQIITPAFWMAPGILHNNSINHVGFLFTGE